MAWLELHQGIWMHRKTLHLATLLAVDPEIAALRMIRLWHWAMNAATPDGDLGEISPAVLAFAANYRGNPSVFHNSLVAAGWLERSPDDSGWRLHDFIHYAGKYLELRASKRFAKRLERSTIAPRPVADLSAAIGEPVVSAS